MAGINWKCPYMKASAQPSMTGIEAAVKVFGRLASNQAFGDFAWAMGKCYFRLKIPVI